VSAYAASKVGLEGWMESLHAEVVPVTDKGLQGIALDPDVSGVGRGRADVTVFGMK
jgi:hypothetical protein